MVRASQVGAARRRDALPPNWPPPVAACHLSGAIMFDFVAVTLPNGSEAQATFHEKQSVVKLKRTIKFQLITDRGYLVVMRELHNNEDRYRCYGEMWSKLLLAYKRRESQKTL